MGKKLMTIQVKGKTKEWCFDFEADPKHMQEWADDGLDIGIVMNRIPKWVVDIGLLRPWCFFQDIFNFRNPFQK